MDIKTIRKKLVKNRISKGSFIVLVLLTVIFLVLGYIRLQSGKGEVKTLAVYRDDAGTYAYIDVVAFDEWACRYGDDTYYVLYDGAGYVYLSVISDATMNKMIKEAARMEDFTHYFNGSYRLYGMVKKTSGAVISTVEETYGLTGQEYNDYLGKCYFNTKESPNSNSAWMWWTFSMFSGLFALIFFIIWFGQELPFNKETRDYTEADLAEVAKMLDEHDPKQNLIVGDKFIIYRNVGMLARYRDILWVHFAEVSAYGANLGRMLRIHTNKRNSFRVAPTIWRSDEQLEELQNAIIEKNPNVLVGYTSENRKLYREMTRSI